MEPAPTQDQVKHGFSGFFRDSRGQFSIFTVIALLASVTLIYISIIEVNNKHFVQTEILMGFIFMYCSNTLSDTLLAAVIARGFWKPGSVAPDTQVIADVTTDTVKVGGTDTAAADSKSGTGFNPKAE